MVNFLKYTLLVLCLTVLSFIVLNSFIPIFINGIVSLSIAVIIVFFLPKETINKCGFNQFYFVTIFLLLIFTPFVGEKENESLEKRKLTEFPEWRWSNVWKFFKEYQNYFNDRFAFRNDAINFYGKFKYEKLGLTNNTGEVSFGKDNWLFYNNVIYINQLSIPFTEQELKKMHYNLVLTTNWFNQKGIKYYLAIPPVKPRIYNDKILSFMKISISYSKLEQLTNYLQKKSTFQPIFFKEELMQAKEKREIYFKTDSHWNQYGAFIGYTKIINSMSIDFPELKPIAISSMQEKPIEFKGDLMNLLGYTSNKKTTEFLLTPIDFSLIPKRNNLFIKPEYRDLKLENYSGPKQSPQLNLYVVRDSYTENLKKFLAMNFSSSTFAWEKVLPIKSILEEKPDIVLHQVVEKFIQYYLKLPPEIENDTAFTNQFNIENF